MAEDPVMKKKTDYIYRTFKELGVNNIYIDPPENKRMKYPCVRVRLNTGRTRYADNKPHIFTPSWEIIYIGYEPDEEMVNNIMFAFSRISYTRHYTADGLHHNSFILYY